MVYLIVEREAKTMKNIPYLKLLKARKQLKRIELAGLTDSSVYDVYNDKVKHLEHRLGINNKGEVNLFAIVGIAYLVVLLIVVLTIF